MTTYLGVRRSDVAKFHQHLPKFLFGVRQRRTVFGHVKREVPSLLVAGLARSVKIVLALSSQELGDVVSAGAALLPGFLVGPPDPKDGMGSGGGLPSVVIDGFPFVVRLSPE